MSNFDKLVAQWVDKSSTSVSTDTRKHILTNISSNLDTYKQLENPDAVKTKELEAARKKKAEEKKAKEEEDRRREEERSSNLPPLGAPRKAKGKKSARKNSAAKEDANAAATGRIKVNVKNVDFAFKENVAKSIEQLEAEKKQQQEKEAAAAAPPPPPPAPAAAETPAVAESSTNANTNNNNNEAVVESTIDPAQKSTATTTHDGNTSSVRSKPPPMMADFEASHNHALTSALKGERDVEFDVKSSPCSSVKEAKVVVHDALEESELVKSESAQYEEHHMNAFTFGAPAQHDDDEEEEKHSEAGDDDEEDKQPEAAPLDDKEDKRRRTLQLKRGTRAGISDVPIDANEAIHTNIATTPKSRDNMKVIERTLERHFLFSFLDDEDISKIASAMDIQEFQPGETIVQKGEVDDQFYLILSGQAVTHAAIESAQQEETVPLGRGDTVGDIALMYASPSEFTVKATEKVECACLQRHVYKIITSRAMEERRQRYAALLDHVPYLSCLTPEERSNLAETLKEGTFSKGQKLISAGAPGNWIHIVVEGTLEVVGSNNNVITTLHEGDCAGHIEFLYGHLSVANVVVSSETAKTARLGKRMFDRLIGTAREVMVKEIEEGQSYEEYRQTMRSEARPEEDRNPAFDDPPLYLQNTLRQQECSMRLQEESSLREL